MGVKAVSGREVRLVASSKTIGDFKEAIEVGEALRGRIVEVFPENKVLVSFKGFNLIAETLLPFKKGDIFYARIEAKSPKVLVKILLPKEGHHGFTDEDAKDFIIRRLGQSPTPERVQIVKHLIRHNLAVTKSMVDEIERRLPLLDGDLSENITALIFMKTHGLKTSAYNVELIKLHLFDRLNIGDALGQLQDALLEAGFEGKERLLNIIEGIFIKLDRGNIDEQIRNFIKSTGVGYENELSNGFDLSQGEREERSPKDGLAKEKNLKMELLRLLGIIRRLDKKSLDPNKIRLQDSIHRVLKHILSSQLTSCQEGEDSYLYLQLPIHPDDGPPQIVELKVYYQDNGREGKIDMDCLDLSLLLHTSKLGMVEIGVGLRQGRVNIEFRLKDEHRRIFLARFIPSLQEGLLSLGYRIGHLTSSVRREDELQSEKEIDLEGVGRIDFRA